MDNVYLIVLKEILKLAKNAKIVIVLFVWLILKTMRSVEYVKITIS